MDLIKTGVLYPNQGIDLVNQGNLSVIIFLVMERLLLSSVSLRRRVGPHFGEIGGGTRRGGRCPLLEASFALCFTFFSNIDKKSHR